MIIEINTESYLIAPYPVMIVLSFLAGMIMLYILNLRNGIQKSIAGYFCILAPVMSAFSGVLLTYISTGGKYGLSSVGGLAGMYAASLMMALISGKSGYCSIMSKNCTLILPLMYSISKTGCLLAGCCRGFPYHGKFCIHYTGDNTEYYAFPVQLTETILFLLIFLSGMFLQGKNRHTVPIIFLLSAVTKFLLDFLRESHTGQILSFTQILCLLLILTELIILIFKNRKNQA